MKRALYIVTIALVLLPALSVSAKVTFHTELESKAAIRREGGAVLGKGGEFVVGVVGNGYMSVEKEDVVHFPMHDMLGNHYLEEGTLELWFTLGWDIDNFTDAIGVDWRDWGLGEVFMFWSYNKAGTDAIGLNIGDGSPNSPIARFMVREAVEEWHIAVSEELPWKEGETHHMAGTWGPNSVNLYLDGEWAGGGDDGHGLPYRGGPDNPIERLSINNNESNPASFPSLSVVDEVKIHDKQLDAGAVRNLASLAVNPGQKLSTTWGAIKRER